MWSANTLTFSAEKESNLFQLSWFDPDNYLLVESHVRSRVSALPLLLVKFCFLREIGIVLCTYLAVAVKVRDFFVCLFFFFLRQMSGHEGEGKEKRGRVMTWVTEKEKDGQY